MLIKIISVISIGHKITALLKEIEAWRETLMQTTFELSDNEGFNSPLESKR